MKTIDIPSIIIPKITMPELDIRNSNNYAGRNLLLNSGIKYENNSYPICSYNITKYHLLQNKTKITISMDADIAENHVVNCYSDEGYWPITKNNIEYDSELGLYIKQCYWSIPSNPKFPNSTKFTVFILPFDNPYPTNTIRKCKLELGWNDHPVWTPAPEDTLPPTE